MCLTINIEVAGSIPGISISILSGTESTQPHEDDRIPRYLTEM